MWHLKGFSHHNLIEQDGRTVAEPNPSKLGLERSGDAVVIIRGTELA